MTNLTSKPLIEIPHLHIMTALCPNIKRIEEKKLSRYNVVKGTQVRDFLSGFLTSAHVLWPQEPTLLIILKSHEIWWPNSK